MTFEIFKAFPPDRDSAIVEVIFRHDGGVDVPAEVYREDGELRIAIFGRQGGVPSEYPLEAWIQAIQRAIEVLG
jgi:hypothetical protein